MDKKARLICDICKQLIKLNEQFNFIFEKYTHKDCDEKLGEIIDKKLIILKQEERY